MAANLARFRRRSLALEGRRHAAVAATVVPGEAGEGCFVITRRADALRRHGGQWALPGGRLDDGETPEGAALRELAEEVGLVRSAADVLGRLDDYPTRSGFVVTPVVVWGAAEQALVPDPAEVASVHRVSLALLEGPAVPTLHSIPESDRPLISIPMLGTHVHAPTAAILYQLFEVAVAGRETRVAHYEQPVFAWR
jgi:mutator protein MutT